MEKQDTERFKAAMKTLASNSSVILEKDVRRIIYLALKHYSIDQIEEGCAKVLRTWKFTRMPPVAIIAEAIEGDQPKLEDKALMCANEIIAHLYAHGSREPLQVADPVAQELMSRRWPYTQWAQTVLTDDLKWWVKDFCAAYEAHTRVEPVQIGHDVKKLLENIGS